MPRELLPRVENQAVVGRKCAPHRTRYQPVEMSRTTSGRLVELVGLDRERRGLRHHRPSQGAVASPALLASPLLSKPPRSRLRMTCSSAALISPFTPNKRRSLKSAG